MACDMYMAHMKQSQRHRKKAKAKGRIGFGGKAIGCLGPRQRARGRVGRLGSCPIIAQFPLLPLVEILVSTSLGWDQPYRKCQAGNYFCR